MFKGAYELVNTHVRYNICIAIMCITAHPTCSDIFKSSKQSSELKLVGLFCHVLVKIELRALALNFASGFGKCHCRWDKLHTEDLDTQFTHIYMCVYIYIYIYVCVCVYIYICVYVYVYIYMYI